MPNVTPLEIICKVSEALSDNDDDFDRVVNITNAMKEFAERISKEPYSNASYQSLA